MPTTYHVELRKFPRTVTSFNQSGEQVGALVLLWVQDRIVEVNDEKWAPWESTITILEGPEIPLGGLSMGRGWKTALREGTDVTERVLAEARRALAPDGAPEPPPAARAAEPPAGADAEDYPSLAGNAAPAAPEPPPELAGLLGAEPARLLAAWRAVASRTGGLTPSESLALAERELLREDRPQP